MKSSPRMRLFTRPDGRYYVIENPEIDLLGDLILVTRRGNEGSKRGGQKIYCCRDTDPGKIERRLVAARLRHGYLETNNSLSQVPFPVATMAN